MKQKATFHSNSFPNTYTFILRFEAGSWEPHRVDRLTLLRAILKLFLINFDDAHSQDSVGKCLLSLLTGGQQCCPWTASSLRTVWNCPQWGLRVQEAVSYTPELVYPAPWRQTPWPRVFFIHLWCHQLTKALWILPKQGCWGLPPKWSCYLLQLMQR